MPKVGWRFAAHPFWQAARRQNQARGVGDLIASLGFDAVEAVNGSPTPSMWAANRRARRCNAGLGRPVVGGSDAHIAEAVGWAHTLFPGRTPEDLRRAVSAGTTQPASRPFGLPGLTRYLAWGLDVQSRQVAPAAS